MPGHEPSDDTLREEEEKLIVIEERTPVGRKHAADAYARYVDLDLNSQ